MNNKIILPIDTKSLYKNIKNDNTSGHTATVATPLKQGNSYNKQLGQILEIKEKEIIFDDKPELIKELIKNSKSKIQIKNVFVFDNIAVNGILIKTDRQYCIFIKEEIDPEKAQYGRLKIHYPNTLKYSDIDLDIDNKAVMNEVSKVLNNYAFIVNSFQYDKITQILNFDAFVVGENDVPYSKIFVNEKGTGNKFTKIFKDATEDYDVEIIAIRDRLGEKINTENYFEFCENMHIDAVNYIKNILEERGAKNIENVSLKYPYLLYDIRYEINGVVRYALVFWTATKIKYFNLSMKKNLFCHDFKNFSDIYLVSDVLGKKRVFKYSIDQIDRLTKQINSMKFTDEGVINE